MARAALVRFGRTEIDTNEHFFGQFSDSAPIIQQVLNR